MGTWSTSGPDSNRRRSQRVILSVPVTVSGQGAKGQFTEDTKTLVVNAHGALLTLVVKVSQGQQLGLKSVSNPEPQTCKVVQTQVGIEFTKPAPHFWHVAFPPENWTPVADESAAVKTPAGVATKPVPPAGAKPSATAPAKAPMGATKPPVPVKASKP